MTDQNDRPAPFVVRDRATILPGHSVEQTPDFLRLSTLHAQVIRLLGDRIWAPDATSPTTLDLVDMIEIVDTMTGLSGFEELPMIEAPVAAPDGSQWARSVAQHVGAFVFGPRDPLDLAAARAVLCRHFADVGMTSAELDAFMAGARRKNGSYATVRVAFPSEDVSAKGRSFLPELGQMIFGQPSQQHEVPPIMAAVLDAIRDEYDRVYRNIMQRDCLSPFGNYYPAALKTPVFEVEAYSWGDDEQPYNFAWRDLRISWYKWCGRGLSSNILITPEMASQCLDECLEHIGSMEDDLGEATETFVASS